MEVVLSTIVLTAAVSCMAIGAIISDKLLSGSCGSTNLDGICIGCSSGKIIVNIHKYSADFLPGILDIKTGGSLYYTHTIRSR